MPANLPPQYYAVEEEYRRAKSAQEKIEHLETMLAIMPKHKGTDHLKAELRAKIAKLQEEGDRQKGAVRTQLYAVRKEGAAQAVLLGPANAGKSQLLAILTGANPKIGDYPFTTQLPMPAMMPVDNAQVQLVDLPALMREATPGWVRGLARQADLLLLVVDLSLDPLEDLALILDELARLRIDPVGGGEEGMTEDLLLRKRALVVANKRDAPDAADNLELLRMELGERLPLIAVSATTGKNLEQFKLVAFRALDIIRVYTKAPGKEPDRTHPFTLPTGSTVADLAESIHKDILRQMRYALVWGSGKFSGQRVSREYELADQDVVEIVT